MDQKLNTMMFFFSLLRAGLWEKDTNFICDNKLNFDEIRRLAKEQCVEGLMAAGIEHVQKGIISKDLALTMARSALQLERRNESLNMFIEDIVTKMRGAGIYFLLVKGQGVAQCYERPLWRASGDMDFYMSESDFEKAKNFYRPIAQSFDPDNNYTHHINMHLGPWIVEIHSNQHCYLSPRIDRVLDEIHEDIFKGGNIRLWNNGHTKVFLPSVDNDVLIIFTHFLKHFYVGGLGIRQICDWCRLLWTFKGKIDIPLLEKRLRNMRLMTEWKSFGAFAVLYLGMPKESLPFYSPHERWRRKAKRICSFIMEVGNMGHNRDTHYYERHTRLIRKTISFGHRCADMLRHTIIFPIDSFRFLIGIMNSGIKAVVHGG